MTLDKFSKWLDMRPIETMIVHLRCKYSHEDEWTYLNELLIPEVNPSVVQPHEYYVWKNDWWEGQQDVDILGCIPVFDVDVPKFNEGED